MHPIIPSKESRAGIIDSSCLIDVLDDQHIFSDFMRWCEVALDLVLIPMATLLEVLPGPPGRGLDRLRALLLMTTTLGNQAVRVIDHRLMIRQELGPVPVRVDEYEWFDFSSLERMRSGPASGLEKWLEEFRAFGADAVAWKSNCFETDRNLADQLAIDKPADIEITPAQIVSTICQASPLHPTDLIIQWALEDTPKTAWTAEKIAARPSRFPVLTLWGHLTFRQNLANCIRSERLPSELAAVLEPFRTKSANKGGLGAWFDNAIAATAAQGMFLVTDDRGLRARCETLRAIGLVRFEVRNLAELAG